MVCSIFRGEGVYGQFKMEFSNMELETDFVMNLEKGYILFISKDSLRSKGGYPPPPIRSSCNKKKKKEKETSGL